MNTAPTVDIDGPREIALTFWVHRVERAAQIAAVATFVAAAALIWWLIAAHHPLWMPGADTGPRHFVAIVIGGWLAVGIARDVNLAVFGELRDHDDQPDVPRYASTCAPPRCSP